MKRIYVAGPLTPHGKKIKTDGTLENAAIEYLYNVRNLVLAAVLCLEKGWAPFCPALDLQYFLSTPTTGLLNEQAIKGLSMAWLEVSDAILMLPGWERSEGSRMEYSRAVELRMPVYLSIEEVPLV